MSFRPTYLAPLVAIVVAGCGTFGQKTDLIVRVVDARTGQAIAGATVDADYQKARTNGAGQTRFQLTPNSYEVTIAHPAFLSTTTTVMLVAGVTASKTVGLYPRPNGVEPLPGPSGDPNGTPTPQPGTSAAPSAQPGEKPVAIFGRVTDETGNRVPNAMVFVESNWGIPLGNARTSAVGEYRVEKLARFQPTRVTVIADGYKSVTRTAAPTSDWRMDFTGAFGLRKDVPVVDPGGPPMVKLVGRVEDTMGRPIDGAIVKAEASGVRYPFNEMAIVRGGRFTMTCPAEIDIRFTATKVAHRPVTFIERLERNSGYDTRLDFTGPRALDPAPILEGGG